MEVEEALRIFNGEQFLANVKYVDTKVHIVPSCEPLEAGGRVRIRRGPYYPLAGATRADLARLMGIDDKRGQAHEKTGGRVLGRSSGLAMGQHRTRGEPYYPLKGATREQLAKLMLDGGRRVGGATAAGRPHGAGSAHVRPGASHGLSSAARPRTHNHTGHLYH